MDDDESLSKADRWARLRFSVVGPLLASPPPAGQLRAELERLARKHWRHPTKDELVGSTIVVIVVSVVVAVFIGIVDRILSFVVASIFGGPGA